MTHTIPVQQIPAVEKIRRMVAGYDGPRDIDGQLRLAESLARAHTALPPMYRDSSGDILAGIYNAIALDIPVMSALHHLFYGGGGRAGMSAALMQALILRAGHSIAIEADNMRATGILTRCDGRPDGTAEWTITEAAVAKLTLNETWLQYPSDCLYARCLARLARRYAADVVLGFGYVPEELSSGVVDEPAANAGTVERPVDPEVAEFLADVDTLTYAETVKKMHAAKDGGLDGRYAGDVGGSPLTVMQVLVNHATLPGTGRETSAPVVVSEVPADEAPAGEGTLDCGCLASVVASTGSHVPDVCTRRAA